MKAELTATGTLVLTPECSTEAYALQCWSERAVVQQADEQLAEKFHYRGSSITISLSDHPDTLQVVVRNMAKAERDAWAREWQAGSTNWGVR